MEFVANKKNDARRVRADGRPSVIIPQQLTKENEHMPSVAPPAHGGNQPPALNLVANNHPFSIPITDLQDPERVQTLVNDLAPVNGQITVNLSDDVLNWSHEERFAVLSFVARPELNWLYVGAGDPSSDLLGAVLSLIPGTDEHQRHERGRRAAIEVVALTCADCLNAACNRVLRRLRELGVKGLRLERLLKEAEGLIRALRQIERSMDDADRCVADVYPDAGAPACLVLPPGWRRNGEAELEGPNGVTIAPILIPRRLVNPITQEESLELAWRRGQVWQRLITCRGVVASKVQIVSLAKEGFPVTSLNAAWIVQYLADYEKENLQWLPCDRVLETFGWTDGACEEFAWGSEIICAPATQDSATPPGGPAAETVVHHGGTGNGQLASAMHASGSLEVWCSMVAAVAHLPVPVLAIVAALAAPLLRILRVANLVVSLVGQTSTGKTTTLLLPASVWGCPCDSQANSLLLHWDASSVAIQRAAAMLSDMAFCVDETNRARKGEQVVHSLYDLTGGKERGRGNTSKLGLQFSAAYRNVTITTGEASVACYTQDGGSHARVLEIWRLPLGATNYTTAQLARHIRESCGANYGHAGPAFIRWILARRGAWGQWRAQYVAILTELQAGIHDNPVAGRMAEAFALLVLTARLATEAELLPSCEGTPSPEALVQSLWPDVSSESREAYRAVAALRFAYSWYASHKTRFPRPGCYNGLDRPQDTSGFVLSARELMPRGGIAFYPYVISKILKDEGYQPDAIFQAWRAKNWLAESAGRCGLRVRDGDTSPNMIAIKQEAFDEVLGEEPPTTTPPYGPQPL